MARLIKVFPVMVLFLVFSISIIGCSKSSTSPSKVDAKLLEITDVNISGKSYSSLGDYIFLDGVVKNNSTKKLKNVSVHVKVYKYSDFKGSGQDECNQSTLVSGASGDFNVSVSVSGSFKDTNTYELTPQCDSGVGDTQTWTVSW